MDLTDSQARAAITALTSKYLSPYLSIYSNVTPDSYLSFQLGVYNTLTEGNPSHPEIYKISNLYAFKSVAKSILAVGHNSKIAFDTNNPNYNPGVYSDKYIEKYLSPTITVDWLTPNLNTLERQKILSKFTSGELDQKSFVAAIGLALAKGQSLTSTTILEARESIYGDDVTLDSSFRTKIADTVGTDAIDTVHMNGDAKVYIKEYSQTDHTFTLTHGQTSKETRLVGVERVEFNDGTRLALDIEGNAGQAYRLYKAAFDRVPDKAGLGFWMTQLDKGMSLQAMANSFVESQEFKTINGESPSNQTLVASLYNHVLGRAPDQGGLDFWKAQLDNHTLDAGTLLVNLSESNENQIALVGQMKFGIEYVI